MPAMNMYAEVVLPLPLKGFFTYSVPSGLSDSIRTGQRVVVPFGRSKKYCGLVWRLHQNKPSDFDTRDVLSVIDSFPLINEIQMQFWEWISHYYLCSPGEVYRAALPSALKTGNGSFQPKTETYIELNPEWRDEQSLNDLMDKLNRAPVQLELLIEFLRLSGYSAGNAPSPVSRGALFAHLRSAPAALSALRKKGIFTCIKKEISRLNLEEEPSSTQNVLSDAQDLALKSIRQEWKAKDVVLLHGVTSSGKTEIYIHLIASALKDGREVLYLLPEIALTTQIIKRLRRVFGGRVAVYHSRYSEAERAETYKLVSEGKSVHVILGARSSIFLPFSHLGLVIVDEEHENTYKQYDPAPRYHARDAAIYLARLHGAKTLLGTATPSLESWHNAHTGKYGLVRLTERFLDMRLPEIKVVDLREAYRKKQMKSHFSGVLLGEIEKTLEAGEQVILFQNRRGFAPFVECAECGWIPRCEHCDVSLTYHQKAGRLVCHYCGYSVASPKTCGHCARPAVLTRGFGTEKVEDEIAHFFREAKVARLDLDSSRSRRSYEKILEDFEQGRVDILVGTQMVSKGLDFQHVKLVGILNADNMLNFPDFRAFERSFQLMAQVSGRAGRKTSSGVVILQTSNIDHPVISDLLSMDLDHFYTTQLQERKTFRYPPFYRLIRFTLKHRDKRKLDEASRQFSSLLREEFGDLLSGPETPLIGRIQKYHLKQIILKLPGSVSHSRVKIKVEKMISRVLEEKNHQNLIIQPDVDPQ